MSTYKQLYDQLDQARGSMMSRLYDFSELTIPGLLPRTGHTQNAQLPVPYSSMPSRGVTRLASRLVTALYPMNDVPFFELRLDLPVDIQQGTDPKGAYEILGRIERRVTDKMSGTNLRSALYTAMQHIIIVGDALLEVTEDYTFAIHRVDNYVMRRRPDGEWFDMTVRTPVDCGALPQYLLDAGFENKERSAGDRFDQSAGEADAVFVHIIKNSDGTSTYHREFDGRVFEEGTYDVCPFVPLGWNHIPGEDYHRGLVEENWSDIRALDGLSESLLDSVAANAEFRFGVNPAGLTEIADIMESENGSFVPAAPNDVFPIQLANQAQVGATQAAVTSKEQALGQVFLMNSASQPTGERVTATQVRVIASELEQALGGVFGSVSRSFQRPIIRRVMLQMVRDGILVPEGAGAMDELETALLMEDGIMKIDVRSGLASLNREVENDKMMQVMQVTAQLPPQATESINWPGMMDRWLATFGIETAGIVKSQEQMQQEQMQAQQGQVAQAGAEAAAVQAGQAQEQPPQPPQG